MVIAYELSVASTLMSGWGLKHEWMGIETLEVETMFAPSVDHQKRDLLFFDGMLFVYGYGVRSNTDYVKFHENYVWYYLSAFPLYRIFVRSASDDVEYLRWYSSGHRFYDHCYRCFKSLFGFGDYGGKGVPLRRRKRDVYLHAISSYSRWYDYVSWVRTLSRLEQCIRELTNFLG